MNNMRQDVIEQANKKNITRLNLSIAGADHIFLYFINLENNNQTIQAGVYRPVKNGRPCSLDDCRQILSTEKKAYEEMGFDVQTCLVE